MSHQQNTIPKEKTSHNTAVTILDQSRTDLQALDEKVKSMMEKGQKKIPGGKNQNGTPKHAIPWICKVCGKEHKLANVTDHIEVNHMEGISFPCDHCSKTYSSRYGLRKHISKFHL